MTGQGDRRMQQIQAGRQVIQAGCINLNKSYRTMSGCKVRGLTVIYLDRITDEKGHLIYAGNRIAVIQGEVNYADKWTQTFWDKDGCSLILPAPAFNLVEHRQTVTPQPQLF